MFNFFKKKVELKNTNVLMDSVCHSKGLKVDSEITVPNNFECLIYYNSKYYTTLQSGKHKINATLLPNLFEKQSKKFKKHKKISLIAHFINTSKQKLKISYKKQVFVTEFQISNTINFAEWILLYTYQTDNTYTYSCVKDLLCELLARFSTVEQINKISTHFGVELKYLEKENTKSSIFNENNTTSIFDAPKQQSSTLEYVDNSTPSTFDIPQPQPISKNSNKICPNCKSVIKFTTLYCLNCGFKLNE